jgi:glucosylglycerate phosphorylase
MNPENRIQRELFFLYGKLKGESIWQKIGQRMEGFRSSHPELAYAPSMDELLTERDVILITYGDQVSHPKAVPLKTLGDFLNRYLKEYIGGVHILPFYPYSSDDGFSVVDYWKVDPSLGGWEDIKQLGKNYRLMFDAVINHISQHSDWFHRFLQGDKHYEDYFITTDPAADLRNVVRPRTHPVLSPFDTAEGVKHIWTTFSSDQVDLNYKNPQVLLEVIDLLLFYVEKGAAFIRLDAIAYLWKEIGTPSIHLPQTHSVIKILRAVLDAVAPRTILITETNVPHAENISYFGELLPGSDRTDEAQMVYQFPLAPLAAHTFISGSSHRLREWAAGLESPQPFFNFIASHDGIGLMPARGLLDAAEIDSLVETTLNHGGRVSLKNNPDGTQSVYELNITLFDLLNDPANPDPDVDVYRFLASQAVMLSMSGVPGIYFHSLFGSRNCFKCFDETGRARTLNREKFSLASLEEVLADPGSHSSRVFKGYRRMLQVRREQPAFHPKGEQRILDLGEGVFGVLRLASSDNDNLLCLINVTSKQQKIPKAAVGMERLPSGVFTDLLSNLHLDLSNELKVEAYQVLWLKLA